jgi:hypothetical protein
MKTKLLPSLLFLLLLNLINLTANVFAQINTKVNFCPSYDGVNCISSTITKFNTSLVTYCQTSNNLTCLSNYGSKCNLSTGYLCTTSDQVNLVNVTTCATKTN